MTIPGEEIAQAEAADTASRLRGFGPYGLLAILVVLAGGLAGPVVGGILVIVWARLSRTPARALGFTRPRSWAATVTGGLFFGIFLKLVMKSVVMPLMGAPPVNEAFRYLQGNTAALPAILATVLVSAALGEELFYRSYMFERLGALLGRGTAALAVTTLISTALFAAAHYPGQGLPGVQQAAVGGLVMAGIYAWRRQIWFLIVTHAAFDLIAVAMIYWNLEEAVAHVFFR